jgi:hypothetical protein
MNDIKITESSLSTKKALIFLIPLGLLIGILVFFIFVVPTSYSQITSRIQSFKSNQEVEDVLTKKLAVLENTSPEVLEKSPQTVIVLPDKNPVLSLISQVKEIAITQNSLVSEVKTGSITEIEENLHRIEFTVGIDAPDFITIAKIVDEIGKRAPVSSVDLLEMQDQLTIKHANLQVSAYWSPLPDSLPAVTDPLSALSPDELALLNQISSFSAPQFSTLSPEADTQRENPFD